jgi:peptidoglycan hydrolase-like protein with peptidoglycan-binding domain
VAEGVDFSWARPGGAAIKAAGKSFVMRYLYPDGQGGKGLDASEVADYRNNGLLIGVVYESSATRALAGYAAGVADANTSKAQLAALSMAGTVVYFGVDFNATLGQIPTLNAYLNGAASVLGKNRIGVYGGIGVIEGCVGVSCDYGWQTYAWSAGRVSDKAHVYQYRNGQILNGGSVDLCRNLKNEFGAFGGTAPSSAGGGTGGAKLMVNQTSLSILQVQQLLNKFGYNLVEDDINGPNTTAAFGNFQATHGLVEDYILGPLSLAKLEGAPAPAPAPPAPAGPAKLVVDGNWGALTTKSEQRALGVTPDGVRGWNTIGAEQARTGAKVDHVDGPDTRYHLQLRLQKLGYYKGRLDRIIGPATIRALQQALNDGKF